MATFANGFISLAALAVMAAGIFWAFGDASHRDQALRWAAGFIVLAIAIPYVLHLIRNCLSQFRGDAGFTDVEVPAWAVIPPVIGHAALASYLIRRRLQGPDHARSRAADLERARGRERTRVPPLLEDRQP